MNFMFVDQQNRYTSLDKCLKIEFFNFFFEILAFGKAFKYILLKSLKLFVIVCKCVQVCPCVCPPYPPCHYLIYGLYSQYFN